MILEAIELEHVGPFPDTARLGPLDPGLNILASDNERGKTTLLQAACRALFDRHTCKSEEINWLCPAGTDLAPQITVTFQCQANRYQISKRFLHNPLSQLRQWTGSGWQLISEGDRADLQLQELLQSQFPGRGASQAAHWGLWQYLWARQGEAVAWPAWEGDMGRKFQLQLARAEIDPMIEKAGQLLWDEYQEYFTNTGQPKTGKPLRTAELELERLTKEWETLNCRRQELEAKQQQLELFTTQLQELKTGCEQRRQEAETLRAGIARGELVQVELAGHRQELLKAREKLHVVEADLRLLEQNQQAQASLQRQNEQTAQALKDSQAALDKASAEADTAGQQREEAAERVRALMQQVQRMRELMRRQELQRELGEHEQLQGQVEVRQAEIERLEQQLGALPLVEPALLKRLEELHLAIRDREKQLEILGVTVAITADAKATIFLSRDGLKEALPLVPGREAAIHAAQTLDLQLPKWGRVSIRSGAAEIQGLQQRLREDQANLSHQLSRLSCDSLEAAKALGRQRAELQTQIASARTAIQAGLRQFATLDELMRRLEQMRAQLAELESPMPSGTGEAENATRHFELQASQCEQELKQAQAGLVSGDAAARQARQVVERKRQEVHTAETAHRQIQMELRTIEARRQMLSDRYPGGIAAARREAQLAFAEAEGRVLAAQNRLPPDFEQLQERSRRANQASAQAAAEHERKQAECRHLEGALQALGASGLYSQEARLTEQRTLLTSQTQAFRLRGWAARLAHDLLDYRKQQAVQSVLGTVEEHLSRGFARISGQPRRRVFLDDQLQIRGIGEDEGKMLPFASLSQGAREQLLLCLRLAAASAVAREERQIVILDDVLVNTDAGRQSRVLDLLRDATRNLQVLVLTCHPERYEGAGHKLQIQD